MTAPRRRLAAVTASAPADDAPDLLRNSLGYAIKRAQVRAYDAWFRVLGDSGLSPARATALALIAGEPDIGPGELAARLRITPPSLVKLVDALQAMGLVERLPHPSDGRRWSLALTDEGQRMLQRLQALNAAHEADLAADLSAEERAELMRLLEKVARGV